MNAATSSSAGVTLLDVPAIETETTGNVFQDEPAADAQVEERGPAWEGPLGLEGVKTADNRLLIPGEIENRDTPLPLNVQLQTGDGHVNSFNCGRIDSVEITPLSELPPEKVSEFGLEDLPSDTPIIWGEGTFDTSEYADEAQRMLANGAGVSLDISRDRVAMFDPQTLEEIDSKDMGLEDMLFGDFVQGFGGKIGGATVVTIPAFEEASIKTTIEVEGDRVLVASAFGIHWQRFDALVAAAGPVKPPSAWFEDPQLRELTPLTITKDGRVYGHLADWGGCHVGFQDICVPPFRSNSNYQYFNTGEIETSDGDLIPCGKLMFSRTGSGHAPTDDHLTYVDAMNYYDDATKVGAFVRAGADRHGTWLAGALRSDLTDLEIQHLRTHPPSGDWRSIGPRGPMELIAAFAVPVGGFPIRRALVASADDGIEAIISAPLAMGDRRRRRTKVMLSARLREVLGMRTKAQIRQETMAALEGPWDDDFAYTAEQRRRMARSGEALPDGSFPIANCADAERAIHAQGRAGNQARAVAHIKKRVRAMNCSGSIFDDYK